MKRYEANDMKLAKVVCEVARLMNKKFKFKFKFFANDNHVEQRSRNFRCALHVITRFRQLARGEHLTHDIQLKDVDAVTDYLQLD